MGGVERANNSTKIRITLAVLVVKMANGEYDRRARKFSIAG